MLTLRAHHLICIQGYLGKGYSKAFVKNMDKVVGSLKDTTLIKVISKVDDICIACPHVLENDCCESEDKVSFFDTSVLEALKIKVNNVYSYGTLLDTIRKNLTLKNFKEICVTCTWFPYGYCEKGCFYADHSGQT